MMLYPSMSQLLKKVDSRYMLVNVVARRAREISAEAEETEEYLEEKSVSIAIKEIADGKISIIKHGEESDEVIAADSEEDAGEAVADETDSEIDDEVVSEDSEEAADEDIDENVDSED